MTMTTPQAQDLIAAFRLANTVRKVYVEFVANPICGKPGRGYKAAKRWRKALDAFMPEYEAQRRTLSLWANETKLSKDRRLARLEKIRAVVPDFELSD